MAFEAALREKHGTPIDFTISDNSGIEKGSLLKISDPRTAAQSDGANDLLAGIAAREKVASDGRTRLAIHRAGIFDMSASGAISVGAQVCSAGADNFVQKAGADLSGAAILGTALETAADAEVIQVLVTLGGAS